VYNEDFYRTELSAAEIMKTFVLGERKMSSFCGALVEKYVLTKEKHVTPGKTLPQCHFFHWKISHALLWVRKVTPS
jgi:hypothetical protein